MLVVFEMANNHGGIVDRGVEIIKSFAPLISEFPSFEFAFKFQARDPSILHEKLTSKLTERVHNTMLAKADFGYLMHTAKGGGFLIGCTPFDEASCEQMVARRPASYCCDFVKVASASLTDWSLLEKIASLEMWTIASTGGATDEEITNAGTFLARRVPKLTLMHCACEYPAPVDRLCLDRLDWPSSLHGMGCELGFSTHEDPGCDLGCILATAKGATVLEWHVDLGDGKSNRYSLNAEQSGRRLRFVRQAMKACEVDESSLEHQRDALQSFRRGVFAAKDVERGEILTSENIKFQLPAKDGQLLANDLGKYCTYQAGVDIPANSPIVWTDLEPKFDKREIVQRLADRVIGVVKQSNVVLPTPAKLILSHHNGLDNFEKVGCGMIPCVNNPAGYCKKLIVMLGGQRHPAHKHSKKTETFHVLWGDVLFTVEDVDGRTEKYPRCIGAMLSVGAGHYHSFMSAGGAVIEEISTTDEGESQYLEPVDVSRKTEVWLP